MRNRKVKSLTFVPVGPGTQQVAKGGKVGVGIVRGQERIEVQAETQAACERLLADDCTGGIRRPVFAIGGERDEQAAGQPAEGADSRQRQFLVAPAAPAAAQGDGGFAARRQAEGRLQAAGLQSLEQGRETSRASPCQSSPRKPVWKPSRAACSSADWAASRLLPTRTFCTRAKSGSPGLGVRARSRSARRMDGAAAPVRPYRSRTASAWARVEGSGAVGPEAIVSSGLPTTSERNQADEGGPGRPGAPVRRL